MGSVNTYIFISTDADAFIALKCSTKKIAQKQIKDLSLEMKKPWFNWEFARLTKKQTQRLLSQYKLNTVYSNE
jgi:hypothetical protein